MSSYSESSTAMQRCRGFCTLGGLLSSLPFVCSGKFGHMDRTCVMPSSGCSRSVNAVDKLQTT